MKNERTSLLKEEIKTEEIVPINSTICENTQKSKENSKRLLVRYRVAQTIAYIGFSASLILSLKGNKACEQDISSHESHHHIGLKAVHNETIPVNPSGISNESTNIILSGFCLLAMLCNDIGAALANYCRK